MAPVPPLVSATGTASPTVFPDTEIPVPAVIGASSGVQLITVVPSVYGPVPSTSHAVPA